MSTPNFTRREQREVLDAVNSQRMWVVGSGLVFWTNAFSLARPEQRPTVLKRMAAAWSEGAHPLPQLTTQERKEHIR